MSIVGLRVTWVRQKGQRLRSALWGLFRFVFNFVQIWTFSRKGYTTTDVFLQMRMFSEAPLKSALKSALKFGELMLKSRARRHFFSSSHLKWVNVMKISLQFASAIFYQTVILNQMLALQKLWKMFFISSKKLFSFSRYSSFCIFVFPSFSPCQPLL